jgi:hypothetical protein
VKSQKSVHDDLFTKPALSLQNRMSGKPQTPTRSQTTILKTLGFNISERTVLRWMRRAPRNPEPAKRRMAFLNNHRQADLTSESVHFGTRSGQR